MNSTAPPDGPASARRGFSPAFGLVLLAILSVAIVAWVRNTAPPAGTSDSTPIAQQRLLRFVDQPDGSISAIDHHNNRLVQNFQGEQGFLRGTLRALVRERRMRSLTEQAPFELIAYRDGRLTLRDPSTSATIALESFGTTNLGVFARLIF